MKTTFYGNVERKRDVELPSVQRQLEVIWKAIDQLNRGVELSGDVIDMLKRVQVLQQQFPLPPPGKL